MLVPHYCFSRDYSRFESLFETVAHRKVRLKVGDRLWNIGEPIRKVYFIRSGIVKTALEHEDGFSKILFYHSDGTCFPGCHNSYYQLENSIVSEAITGVDAWEFDIEDFYNLVMEDRELNAQVLETYASYINLFLYQAAHQDYNPALMKIANLLYLFSLYSPTGDGERVNLSQQDIADILAISHINVAKNLAYLRKEGIIESHRKWIRILDLDKLESCCSVETLLPDV